eukprot:g19308.t1
MKDLLSGTKVKDDPVNMDLRLWDAIEKIGYRVRDERLPHIDLELCQRLYKRGEYLPHYIYLSQFPDYNPAMVQNRGPGADLPAVLMVAEKPSIAKIIAEHLSGGRYRTRRALSRACQTYEFVCAFRPAQQKCKLIVTSVIGHVFGLTFTKQKGLRPEDMFDASVTKELEDTSRKMRVPEHMKEPDEHLQELAKECEYLALWLDCDREGENICYEVISLCREHFPTDGSIYRAHFSAITEQEIWRSYEDLRRPNKFLAMSVDARQELDLKVGIAFSTLLKWNFLDAAKRKFPKLDLKMLTLRRQPRRGDPMAYGPCQTPTLWFCVERHREISGFKKERWFQPCFEIVIDDGGGGYGGSYNDRSRGGGKAGGKKGDHFKGGSREEEKSPNLVFATEKLWKYPTNLPSSFPSSSTSSNARQRNNYASTPNVQILRVSKAEKVLKRPVGLNTVQMLKSASSLGLSPGTAMKVAEDLYSAGYISYPRTESTKYADSYNITEVLQQQTHAPWGKTVEIFLREHDHWVDPASISNGHDAGDHPPITPCGPFARREDMKKGSQWKLYEYVCKHFLASVMDDAYYTEYIVSAKLPEEGSGAQLSASNFPSLGASTSTPSGNKMNSTNKGGAAGGKPPHKGYGAEVGEDFSTSADTAIFTCTFHTFEHRGFLFATPWKADAFNDKTNAWRRIERSGVLAERTTIRGSKGIAQKFKIAEGSTEPPQYLKESELVALMDKHGIGTDASMAGHIDNVVARGYCKVCGPCTDGSGKPGDPVSTKGKGKGKTKGGDRPTSRHMVPTGLGLA